MELDKFYGFVLLVILVGMLVGVGALTLDKFGEAAKNDVPVSETVAISSDAGQLANDEVVSVEAVYNASTTFTSGTNYNVTLASGAVVTSGLGDDDYTFNYTYSQDSVATTAAGSGRTEVAAIASNWLGLIVTIAVLAIIMGLVIAGFAGGRQ